MSASMRRPTTCWRRLPSPASTSPSTRARPARSPRTSSMPRHIHGEDGLGGAPRPVSTTTIAGADAVGFLAATFRQAADAGERVDILMIGPLTNLALVLQRDPGLVSRHRPAHHHGRHGLWPRQLDAGSRVQHLRRPGSRGNRVRRRYRNRGGSLGALRDALSCPAPRSMRCSSRSRTDRRRRFRERWPAMRARPSPAMAMATISASSIRSRPPSSSNPAS